MLQDAHYKIRCRSTINPAVPHGVCAVASASARNGPFPSQRRRVAECGTISPNQSPNEALADMLPAVPVQVTDGGARLKLPFSSFRGRVTRRAGPARGQGGAFADSDSPSLPVYIWPSVGLSRAAAHLQAGFTLRRQSTTVSIIGKGRP
jgi:hypothetical protein